MDTKPPDTVQLIQKILQEEFDPFWRWDQIHLHVTMALRQQIAGMHAGAGNSENVKWLQVHEITDPDFANNIAKLATEIDEVSGKATDASIFAIIQLGRTGCPVTHSMRTAFVCSLIARELGMSEAERQVLTCAALTMNIAILDLQEVLHKQATPLTEAQRAAIRTHPTRSREHLETFNVANQDWLRAVAEHHEIAEGKGYPAALDKVFPFAEIIQYADTYCTMTRPRAHRKALQSNRAAYKLFIGSRSTTSSIPGLIVKMLGIYPPGNVVRLANGDVAVVIQRGEHPKAPKVCSLYDHTGANYSTPTRRPTGTPEFAIVDVVPADEMKLSRRPSQLFGYEK